MTTAPPSPKRRHILSSINPERAPLEDLQRRSQDAERAASASASASSTPAASFKPSQIDQDAASSGPGRDRERSPERRRKRTTSKFRFKSKHSSSHRSSRHRDRDREREGEGKGELEGENGGDDNGDDDDEDTRRYRRHRRRREQDGDEDGYNENDNDNDHDDDREHKHKHKHKHHRHKRRRRHHRSRTRSPTPPNPYEPPPLSPDAAFRASLFDAMADDEGAAYWEAVYGQPMHVYGRDQGGGGEGGELEQMDDEEYAAYVRQKMWEKTHEGLLEDQARREEARRRRDHEARHARRLARDVDSSLRRGELRRRQRAWRDRWDAYVAAWARFEDKDQNHDDSAGAGAGGQAGHGRHLLEHDTHPAWPVESGRRADVRGHTHTNTHNDDTNTNTNTNDKGHNTTAVREFFTRGLDAAREEGDGEQDDAAPRLLKDERVRWHPDKVQQRLGGRVDEALMRDVTAVFQVVDALWADARAKAKAGG